MSDTNINVDPYERLKFSEKLIAFESDMKDAVNSLKDRLDEASGHLQDPGSQYYIAEAQNLVEALKALLNGTATDAGNEHKSKALQQIQLIEDFSGKMSR